MHNKVWTAGQQPYFFLHYAYSILCVGASRVEGPLLLSAAPSLAGVRVLSLGSVSACTARVVHGRNEAHTRLVMLRKGVHHARVGLLELL